MPERRGTLVAEKGALAAGQHRRHPMTVASQARVANCVDPAVERVQTAGCEPVVHRVWSEPEPEELRPCDDTVLASSNLRDRAVGWST